MTFVPSPACSMPRPKAPASGSTRWVSASASKATTVASYGVYVHIPFCLRRCDYCAFATWDDRGELIGAYVEGLRRELGDLELPAATSVFFGGGTPSLLTPEQLASVL